MSEQNQTLDLPGIYMIKNDLTDKVYVGRAVNIRKRWNQHRHHLRRGNHHCSPLQRAWNKYGESVFSFAPLVLNVKTEAELCELENYYISQYKCLVSEGGYNVCPSSGTNRGVKYTAESRVKMSQAQKGRIVTPEHRAKIAQTLTGRSPSDECRQKRSKAMAGRVKTPEMVQRQTEAIRVHFNTPVYEAFGKSQTVNEWAAEYGINQATLRNRLFRSGESLEKALTGGKRQSIVKGVREHVVNGVTATVREHCMQYGVNEKNVRNYIGRNGMTAQQAIELAIAKKEQCE